MAPAAPIDAEPERRFIGRRRELDALRAALERAAGGDPRIVLLTGEPGIGKSRTAGELAVHAARGGVLALAARCPEEPGAPPYWPWLQLIRQLVAALDADALGAVVGAAAAPLAALDPQARGRLAALADGSAPTPVETDAAKARFRLFDAIAGFWQRAAAHRPLLLLIDDLHRADVASLRLLEFVLAAAGRSRLMVLGTYRDAEVSRRHPLSDTLAELHRHASVQRLLLGGFSAVETAEFVGAALGTEAAELAAALFEQTEGHPLFLAELARDLQARGAGLATGRAGALRVPSGVRDVIGARLNRLTPRCVQVLQHAAVFGREFRADLLGRLLDDLSDDDCAAALDEARAASLVDASGADGSWQFAHALVRDALYDELPVPRRARLHQHIGAVLEHHHRADLTPCLSALAYHYHAAGHAGDAAKAIEYATRAAERASAMQAHEEASRHYRRACAALSDGAGHDAQRGALLLRLGDAQISAGASVAALATFADAAAGARRRGDAALLARAAIGYGDAQWRLGTEGSQAVALIREALAQPALADAGERVALLSALCRALLFANRPDEAEAAFREAVATARRLGDPLTQFKALSAILPGRWFPDRLALRIEAAREAIALSRHTGRPELAAPYVTGWHTGDLMEAGETAEATATARFHLATGATMREPFNEAVGLAALAMIATHEGRFAEAESLAADAMACGARFDRANAAGILGVQMFTLRRLQGRLGEVAPVLQQFLARDGQAIAWRPGLAVLHCELGAHDAARDAFETLAAGDFAGIAHDAIRIASLAYLAEVCAWLDDRPRAAVLYALLQPYAGRTIVFGAHTASFGAADRLLGRLAATCRQWDVAARHFEAAIDFDTRTGGRPWRALARHAFAAMQLRRADAGAAAAARPLLDAALDEARALGMRGLEDAAREALATLDAGAAADAPRPAAAGLSKREVEVLQLVAAGRTNQEIAAALFRSPNTVANHVRAILGKTGAANRAEAAAFAARHGLLPPR